MFTTKKYLDRLQTTSLIKLDKVQMLRDSMFDHYVQLSSLEM